MSKKGVTGKWVVLAGVLLAAAIGFAAWGIFGFVTPMMDMFPYRTAIPGQAEFYLPKAGQYDVALEERWTDANGLHCARVRGDMLLHFIAKDGGRELALTPARATITYQNGQRSGRVLYHVDVPAAGTYVLKGEFRPPDDSAAVIAVGKGFDARAMVLFAVGCCSVPPFFIIFILLLIFYLVGRAKRNPAAAQTAQ